MDEQHTLPELLSHAEKLARQLMDHLRYDVGPKAQRLVDSTRPESNLLVESEEFTERLYREWATYSQQICQIDGELTAGSNAGIPLANGGHQPPG